MISSRLKSQSLHAMCLASPSRNPPKDRNRSKSEQSITEATARLLHRFHQGRKLVVVGQVQFLRLDRAPTYTHGGILIKHTVLHADVWVTGTRQTLNP